LMTRNFLLIAKIGEVFVVGPNFEGVRAAFEVMTEGFKGTDDGKKFFVVDIVVEFRGKHGFGVKSNRVPSIEEVGLFEDGPKGEIRSIGDEAKGTSSVRESKDRR
jgi:hypothetical protein